MKAKLAALMLGLGAVGLMLWPWRGQPHAVAGDELYKPGRSQNGVQDHAWQGMGLDYGNGPIPGLGDRRAA